MSILLSKQARKPKLLPLVLKKVIYFKLHLIQYALYDCNGSIVVVYIGVESIVEINMFFH